MNDVASLIGSAIRAGWNVAPHRDIVSWALDAIDFSGDVSAERSRLDLDLSPFLVEPLRAWEFSGKIREVAVCGIEQHGKTLLEVIGVLYNFLDKPCSNLCVYPSDDKAADINRTKYEPLMRKIPELAAELARPFSSRKDRYVFGGATMFFQGAGAKIASKSCKIRVLDEEDIFKPPGNLDPAEDTRKRGRSYSESILYRVCTPTTADGPIWRAFLAGSQGYWTLRCLHCGELSMRSCDLLNFQFESVYSEEQGLFLPTPGTERLICPRCRHEHTERDKAAMNRSGAYVHRFEERRDLRPSFQFGALCSQLPLMSWGVMAAKILESGRRADIKAHQDLDNSVKGLPYTARKISTEDLKKLEVHFFHAPPPLEKIEMAFVVSDTQDTFSPTGLFALDCDDNLYLLEYDNIPYLCLGMAEREEIERREGGAVRTAEDLLNAPVRFPGGGSLPPLFHVVDYRGHRQREVASYAATRRNVIMYAGTSLRAGTWKASQKNPRLILADAKSFQRVLIWQLYSQKNRQVNYLYLPDTLDPKYQAEISSVQPGNSPKSGHLPENWEPQNNAVHDAFDVLKMAYFAVDFAINSFARARFRVGRSPALLRRWRAYDERRRAEAEKPPG